MQADLLLILRGGIFVALLLAASVIDIRKRIIPNTLCAAIALTSMIQFEPVNLFGVFVAAPFLLDAIFKGGMGGGDIKLMAASGIVLGITKGIAAAIVGLTVMLLFYVGYCIVQNLCGRKKQKSFPLAPFLSIGCVAALLINTGGYKLCVF